MVRNILESIRFLLAATRRRRGIGDRPDHHRHGTVLEDLRQGNRGSRVRGHVRDPLRPQSGREVPHLLEVILEVGLEVVRGVRDPSGDRITTTMIEIIANILLVTTPTDGGLTAILEGTIIVESNL